MTTAQPAVKKRQIAWDWAKGCASKVLPEKKQKVKSTESESYTCLQCFELHLKGKRDKRFASLCRMDTSSVKRHKERWHNLPDAKACDILPATAPEVASLKEKYAKKDKSIEIVDLNVAQSAASHSCSKAPNDLDDPEDPEDVQSISATLADITPIEPMEPLAPVELECTESLESLAFDVTEKESSEISKKCQSTLLSFRKQEELKDEKEVSLSQVMQAVEKLSLKVEGIATKHATLEQLAFEDSDVHKCVIAMRSTNNIIELSSASKLLEWFYDEGSENAVLRCLPCFKLLVEAKPTLANLTPAQVQRLLNSTSSGTLATGISLKRETTRLLIEGHNRTWYRYKHLCIEHLCLIGKGSVVHKKAMEAYQQKKRCKKERKTTASNLFRAAIVDLKLGAAGRNFETLVSFLACCSVNVGNIGHSRNMFNDILYCLEKSVNQRMSQWLNRPLPSTLLPPHFWVTIDKATPSRATNQAVLIVARDENGIPCPIPVAAPSVYKDFGEASYDTLADQLLKAISENFSPEVLQRLCGVAADGPYQATGFRTQLLTQLDIPENSNQQIALPVTWDTAHVLNLAVTAVRDGKSASGEHFRRFIKRCNVFNNILSHGKGFAFLQMVDASARRPVTYATQRFMSSSYEQWLKIEDSYDSFWKAFEMLHPRRSEEEELQYMIAGSDFVEDLLSFLDVMDPIMDLMLRAQSLDTPVWKLKLWWPKVKSKLLEAADGNPNSFPRLQKCVHNLKPEGEFKGVKLLEGWLVVKDANRDEAGNNVFTWRLREDDDVKQDRQRLAEDLCAALDRRVESVTGEFLSVLEAFDAGNLVHLHCGTETEGGVKYVVSEGEYEAYGVEESKIILSVMSQMKHVETSGINFDPRMAYSYMSRIKNAIRVGIWERKCPEWFVDAATNKSMAYQEVGLVEFVADESASLDLYFKMAFANGKVKHVRLHEQQVYQSFYSNAQIFNIAKPPSCAMIDVVLAKGGPEAIAESFYSSMRAQQQSGGQMNETLARRTKLNWCLPSLRNCHHIIKDGVKIYLKGDEALRPHRQNTFFSGRGKYYNVSKVVDRVDGEKGRCPFLADE